LLRQISTGGDDASCRIINLLHAIHAAGCFIRASPCTQIARQGLFKAGRAAGQNCNDNSSHTTAVSVRYVEATIARLFAFPTAAMHEMFSGEFRAKNAQSIDVVDFY
jgi:hypothetical protein